MGATRALEFTGVWKLWICIALRAPIFSRTGMSGDG